MAAPSLAGVIEGRGRYLRPTGVVGRAVGGQNVAVQIIGLREAQLIPEQLRATYEIMLQRLRLEVQEAARAVVPGGAEGKLGRQVHAVIVRGGGVTNRIVIGTIGSEFARALNRGFTSTPKTARALRFEEAGQLVFTRRVRVAGRHFYEKWLAITPPIVESTYNSSFYNIRDLH